MTRAQQAAATRLRVLERSVDVFLAKGFAGSSTRELAAAGGVTEKTLFNIFGSKAELLRQGALHVIVGADRPLLERSDFDAALHAADGPAVLAGFAAPSPTCMSGQHRWVRWCVRPPRSMTLRWSSGHGAWRKRSATATPPPLHCIGSVGCAAG